MSGPKLAWYWRRLRRMSTTEVAVRARHQVRQTAWRGRQVHPGGPVPPAPAVVDRRLPVRLPASAASDAPEDARTALLQVADGILAGHWQALGVTRDDVLAPDWFLDPISRRRAPQHRYSFGINHRSPEQTGDVKQVWELSRHHHLTTLAAAWFLTGDDRYADVVASQLIDWWQKNPFLSGVHWTSGIELGIRLVSWSWIRRLLDGWTGVAELFDDNEDAIRQIHWHQEYLFAFPSAGSSANNHVIAEAAGQLVASCSFRWFRESGRWRTRSTALLERQLEHNTFPSGVNRELASEYHCLVAELAMVAAVEADAAGFPLGARTWDTICRMVDAAAALVDQRGQPPRQGDGDDGRALLVDAPGHNHWPSLLAAGAGLFGPLAWWPAPETRPDDVRSRLLAALVDGHQRTASRPARRMSHFADAGLTLLRTGAGEGNEVWCRCDAGPHGHLRIAAHAHADALSVEVRHGGVDILVDPGTYCYHGRDEWRAYFRSTLAHNTLELGGQDQSVSGGPFLWVSHASTRLVDVVVEDEEIVSWLAEHDGYQRLRPPAVHRRRVTFDRAGRRLEIVDWVESEARQPCRLAFHLGPAVRAELDGPVARLGWDGWSSDARSATAELRLPAGLTWSAHRGEVAPVLGWYSPGFGRKEPTITLVGVGAWSTRDGALQTILDFAS